MALSFGYCRSLIFVFALAATALAQSPVSDDTFVTSACRVRASWGAKWIEGRSPGDVSQPHARSISALASSRHSCKGRELEFAVSA